MPISPGTLDTIGAKVLRPFSSMKLHMLSGMNEPTISQGGFSLPYKITPDMVKKLVESGVVDSKDPLKMMRLIADPKTRVKTFAALETVNSKIAEKILNAFVVRNGKAYSRNIDSHLNSMRKITNPDILAALKTNKLADPIETFLPQAVVDANATTGIIANALKTTGAKFPSNISVFPGGSLYSKPSSIVSATEDLRLNNPLITQPTHEIYHAKDFQSSKLKKYLPTAGGALAKLSLGATPVSILYGDEISKVIPGTVDDKIVKAFKYAGPEMYLLGSALQHSPEFSAVRNTKNAIKKNPEYYENLSATFGMPTSASTLSDIQDVRGRTYPSGLLLNYGLLRAGTLPLYLAKQSSLQSPHVGIGMYGDVAKWEVKKRIDAVKNFILGAKDPEVVKSLLYHDSANKYKTISSVIPAALVAGIVPGVLLGEYFSYAQKPKPQLPAPKYEDDIKQGLGA